MQSRRSDSGVSKRSVGEARHIAVEAEIRGEKASALGDAARRVQHVLDALRKADPGPERDRLLDDASDAVWGFFIQRELMGLRDRDDIIAYYGIPKEVLNRIGMIRR
jgi:hypothetical protein